MVPIFLSNTFSKCSSSSTHHVLTCISTGCGGMMSKSKCPAAEFYHLPLLRSIESNYTWFCFSIKLCRLDNGIDSCTRCFDCILSGNASAKLVIATRNCQHPNASSPVVGIAGQMPTNITATRFTL